jgi:hypothetical protein
MATINSAATRGSVQASGTDALYATWEEIRDFPNGTGVLVNTNNSQAIRVSEVTTKLTTTWTCYRYFMAFDTSAITSVPGSATLYIYGNTTSTSDLIAVKSTAPTTSTNIATTNYSDISGYVASNSMAGLVTDYSSAAGPGLSTTAYNAIPLNSAALSDMNSLTTFKLALVNYSQDYLYVAPLGGQDLRMGISITNAPYITYTGFGGKIYSISLASISKVDDTAISNIGSINV